MWFLLLKAAFTGIFGSAFGKWFLTTRMGRWFQDKLNAYMQYLAVKYDIKEAKREAKWKSEYPGLVTRLDDMEKEIKTIKKASSGVKRVPRKKA